MPFELLDIDHLMVRVADLPAAVAAYQALGFQVAPPVQARTGEMPAPVWDNRAILFDPYPGRTDIANFLALACLADEFAAPWALRKEISLLWDTEGPRTLVCLSTDLERTLEAMIAEDVEVRLPPPSRAGIETGWWDGDTWLPLRSRPCNPVFRQTPFMVNAYATENLATLQHPPYTEHPNTARHLLSVTGVTRNLTRDAEWMATRVFDVPVQHHNPDIAVVQPRDIALRMVTPEGWTQLYGTEIDFSTERVLPSLAAATIAVTDLGRVREILDTNGVPWHSPDGFRVVVPRHAACNTVIEFTDEIPTEAP